MKNSKPTFTTAALSALLVLGIQHSDFGSAKVNPAVVNSSGQANEVKSFAIRVDNYEETMQWYRENLNATVEGEWSVPSNPDAKLAYLNVYGFRVKVLSNVKLSTNHSQVNDFGKYQITTTGLNKAITLQVNNLNAVINDLKKQGVTASIKAANQPTIGKKAAWVKDNNGNLIKLSQSIEI
ncbi:MAG: VOC family protein [Cyanobacteria bacterium P01_G01_bin.67]